LSSILSLSGGDTLVPFNASHPMIPFTSHHLFFPTRKKNWISYNFFI
jgi:hypothetical protein